MIQKEKKAIDRTSFSSVGEGVWESKYSNYGISGVITEETGSSRALREGFMPNQRAYSVSTFSGGTDMGNSEHLYSRRSDAIAAAKEEMKGWLDSIPSNRPKKYGGT